ncbi:hypothetical protein [Desulfococcus sp.]|uniref:hypothetical protein n=1 Tax=Desulfococcus sp. TaxID=2025834 RepID=UPI0035946F95
MNDVRDEPAEGGGEEENTSICPLVGEDARENPDLCCCYVIDAGGAYANPCHAPFENRCC